MHQTLISSLPMDDSYLDWECSSPCVSCWYYYLHEYALIDEYLDLVSPGLIPDETY